MTQETRRCVNCEQDFVIRPEDFAFYGKMSVPAPTFCPDCRFGRRLAWRNERSLYRRASHKSGKSIICLYSEDKPFPVYDQAEWWADDWDASEFGVDYNFLETFFKQFRSLQEKVPRLSIFNTQCVNSEYTNQSYENKNCYLCFSLTTSEDSTYCTNIGDVKNSLDSLYVFKSELLYNCIDSEQCYRSSFLINCESCVDSVFLFDCRGCTNCIGAVGLRNKSNVFWGEELTPQAFAEKKKVFDLGNHETILEGQKRFTDLIKPFPRRAARLRNCTDSTGDFIRDSKGAYSCFGSYDLENAHYCTRIYGSKDVADSYGLGRAELAYETIGTEEVYNVKFTNVVDPSKNLAYCDLCFNISDCFGCVGLRSKQYYVFNKPYSKLEYEALVPKIIEHMNAMPYIDRAGRVYKFGEFFPIELSPFSYNETIAQDYFPLTKFQCGSLGYAWKEPEIKAYAVTKKPSELSDHVNAVSDDMLKEVIGCAHDGKCNDQCTTAFKLIPAELAFYRQMNLPVPRLCPNCRHHVRLKQRNPFKLWKRRCSCGMNGSGAGYQNTTKHSHGDAPCPNEFETSYAPNRPELVYCEACYLNEVQ